MEKNKLKKIRKIDCEPKWVDLHPLFTDWIRNGTSEQKEIVIKELGKLAKIGDIVRQAQKKGEEVISLKEHGL